MRDECYLSIMGNYRKGWALRYMREAKAELLAAQKTPSIANSLILEAMRKAQAAIYYSLGDPAFIESIVYQAFYNPQQSAEEPVLKCLIEIERTIQRLSQTPETEFTNTIEQVNDIVRIASDIVELFTGEKA
ncbi:MAG: hypothetical protein JSV51_05850 [Candidatus Bathyarchaeota archaeon]|nr:MAG: hypothetical protein JSV51_05850 [Candidatus Bathyarchaeota archaeon]